MSVDRVTPGGSRTHEVSLVCPPILPRPGLLHNSYLYAGCDVSADWLDVTRGLGPHLLDDGAPERRRFANDAAGHAALCRWLRASGHPTRIVVEASGVYSLDLTLALHAAEGIDVMLVNPRAAKDYRRSRMHRSKTDEIDAAVLCDYVLRMPFVAWEPPEDEAVELRQLARRIADLTVERAREKNRLHAARASRTASTVLINDIEVNLRHLDRRIDEMVRQALKVVGRTARLSSAYGHLTSVRGIAAKSAVMLLGELMCLPEGMSVREWVAHAGLDVRKHRSGRSVEERPRISKQGSVHGPSTSAERSTCPPSWRSVMSPRSGRSTGGSWSGGSRRWWRWWP